MKGSHFQPSSLSQTPSSQPSPSSSSPSFNRAAAHSSAFGTSSATSPKNKFERSLNRQSRPHGTANTSGAAYVAPGSLSSLHANLGGSQPGAINGLTRLSNKRSSSGSASNAPSASGSLWNRSSNPSFRTQGGEHMYRSFGESKPTPDAWRSLERRSDSTTSSDLTNKGNSSSSYTNKPKNTSSNSNNSSSSASKLKSRADVTWTAANQDSGRMAKGLPHKAGSSNGRSQYPSHSPTRSATHAPREEPAGNAPSRQPTLYDPLTGTFREVDPVKIAESKSQKANQKQGTGANTSQKASAWTGAKPSSSSSGGNKASVTATRNEANARSHVELAPSNAHTGTFVGGNTQTHMNDNTQGNVPSNVGFVSNSASNPAGMLPDGIIHLSSYEDRSRGGRAMEGQRMLYDPKSGSLVAVKQNQEANGGRTKKEKKKAKQNRDRESKHGQAQSSDKPTSDKDAKNKKDDGGNTKAKAKSGSNSSQKSGKKKKDLNKQRKLPRTCGVMFAREKKAVFYCVDGCDGDLGYGSHSVPGGRTKNESAYDELLEVIEQYGGPDSEGVHCIDFSAGLPGHDAADGDMEFGGAGTGDDAQSADFPQDVAWLKPNEKIELVTGVDDSPMLQATAKEWAPSKAALAATSTLVTTPTKPTVTQPMPGLDEVLASSVMSEAPDKRMADATAPTPINSTSSIIINNNNNNTSNNGESSGNNDSNHTANVYGIGNGEGGASVASSVHTPSRKSPAETMSDGSSFHSNPHTNSAQKHDGNLELGLGFDPTIHMESTLRPPDSTPVKGLNNVNFSSLSLESPAFGTQAASAATSNIFAFGAGSTWGSSGSNNAVADNSGGGDIISTNVTDWGIPGTTTPIGLGGASPGSGIATTSLLGFSDSPWGTSTVSGHPSTPFDVSHHHQQSGD